jgi:hypothetical protein
VYEDGNEYRDDMRINTSTEGEGLGKTGKKQETSKKKKCNPTRNNEGNNIILG